MYLNFEKVAFLQTIKNTEKRQPSKTLYIMKMVDLSFKSWKSDICLRMFKEPQAPKLIKAQEASGVRKKLIETRKVNRMLPMLGAVV